MEGGATTYYILLDACLTFVYSSLSVSRALETTTSRQTNTGPLDNWITEADETVDVWSPAILLQVLKGTEVTRLVHMKSSALCSLESRQCGRNHDRLKRLP